MTIKIVGIVLLSLIALIVIILHFSATVYLHAAKDGVSIRLKFMGFTLYPRKPRAKRLPKQKRQRLRQDDKPPENVNNASEDEITDDMLMQGLTAEQERTLLESIDTADNSEGETLPDTVLADDSDDGGEKWDGEPEDDDLPELQKNEKKKKSKKEDSSKKEGGGLKAKIRKARSLWETVKPYIPIGWKYFRKLCKAVRFRIDDVQVVVGREDAHEAAIYYGIINAAIADLLQKLAMIFTCKVKRCRADVKWAENHISGSADISVRVRPSTIIAIAFCVGVRFLCIFLSQKLKNRKNKKAENSNNASPEPAL